MVLSFAFKLVLRLSEKVRVHNDVWIGYGPHLESQFFLVLHSDEVVHCSHVTENLTQCG